AHPEPLRLNLRGMSRLNSIGIRNLLKFISAWSPKTFIFEECPSVFIDQVNMIPALTGVKGQGSIETFYVPYECEDCGREEDFLGKAADYASLLKAGKDVPQQICGGCGGPMLVLTDSYFVFLTR